MRAAWMVAVLAGGCGFEAASTGGSAIDAPRSDSVDAPGTEACPWSYTVPGFEPCPYGNGMFGALDLTEPGVYVYDTELNTFTSPTGAAVMVSSTTDSTTRVIWTKRLRIANGVTLRGTGNLPLIVVSQSDITIEGTLDVGSHVAGTNKGGAGSDPPACSLHVAGDGLDCTDGGSGGGGGGFGTAGNAGGVGGFGRCAVAGGTGGMASPDSSFRGGCDGGEGGNGDSDDGGNNGNGGGATHLIARAELAVRGTGRVLAGGSGGEGSGGGRSGAGGGGSGGLIMLSAYDVRVEAGAVVAANGGGGGGGANQMTTAGDGEDGQPSATPARGGTPENNEGAGGAGAAGNVVAMPGIGLDRGGGGGGGGVGKIRISGSSASSVVLLGVISPISTP